MSMTAEDIVNRAKELRKPGKIKGDDLYVLTSEHSLDVNTNPCIVEEYLTRKCLYKNSYDRLKCKDALDNSEACGKFWGKVKIQRFMNGQTPVLPLPEERVKIKQDYMNSQKQIHRGLN